MQKVPDEGLWCGSGGVRQARQGANRLEVHVLLLAAEHALPVDLLLAVLVALLQTRTIGLHLALFASQVLLLRLLFHAQLSLAINHTAKVGHLAVVALVERALMHCKFKEFSLVKVAFLGKSLVFIESLVFSYI